MAEGERLELSSPFGRRISSAVAYQFAYPSRNEEDASSPIPKRL